MSGEAGGWMWIVIDVGAVVLLAGALAYGMWTLEGASQSGCRTAA